jgi:hypothetical protein
MAAKPCCIDCECNGSGETKGASVGAWVASVGSFCSVGARTCGGPDAVPAFVRGAGSGLSAGASFEHRKPQALPPQRRPPHPRERQSRLVQLPTTPLAMALRALQ